MMKMTDVRDSRSSVMLKMVGLNSVLQSRIGTHSRKRTPPGRTRATTRYKNSPINPYKVPSKRYRCSTDVPYVGNSAARWAYSKGMFFVYKRVQLARRKKCLIGHRKDLNHTCVCIHIKVCLPNFLLCKELACHHSAVIGHLKHCKL